ncbi:MAG: class D sortase [Bacillota bacterium]|nr:class D sortase [Bacillota bacterium]
MKNWRLIVGGTLIVVGLGIVGTAFFLRWSTMNNQKKMINNYKQEIKHEQKVKEKDPDKKPPDLYMGTLGIITIPKIDLEVAIGEGVDMATLKNAVGHFPDTAMPGEKGNFCLAGHRSYTYNQFFNRLDEVKIGDEIYITTLKGNFKYKVYKIQEVDPSHVEVLQPDKDHDYTMTLVTCTPVRIATHRLIVKAELEK